jgi:hypothetical protein
VKASTGEAFRGNPFLLTLHVGKPVAHAVLIWMLPQKLKS